MIILRILSLFLFLYLLGQGIVQAGEIEVGDPTIGVASFDSLLSQAGDNPEDTIANIISYGLGIVGVLAVMAATWAGIQIIIAAGDEEKVKKSRMMIIYAMIGVVVA
jgi:hypothetical protein